jgi:hypothetical protein
MFLTRTLVTKIGASTPETYSFHSVLIHNLCISHTIRQENNRFNSLLCSGITHLTLSLYNSHTIAIVIAQHVQTISTTRNSTERKKSRRHASPEILCAGAPWPLAGHLLCAGVPSPLVARRPLSQLRGGGGASTSTT